MVVIYKRQPKFLSDMIFHLIGDGLGADRFGSEFVIRRHSLEFEEGSIDISVGNERVFDHNSRFKLILLF